MKSFEVKALGLEELKQEEMMLVDGGNVWIEIGKFILTVIAGWAIEEGLDAAKEKATDESGDIYDANFDGQMDNAFED